MVGCCCWGLGSRYYNMSYSSFFWKKQLKRDVSYILKKMDVDLGEIKDEEKLDQIFSTIEIKLFTIAYSLRKLIDTNKVSTKLSNTQIKILAYPKNSSKITIMNNHRLDEHYDFSGKIIKKLYIRDICNQIIHSYIFQLGVYGDKLFYIFFNSDYKKNKYLSKLKIKDLLKIVIKFTDNYPKRVSMIYCEEMLDYEITCK